MDSFRLRACFRRLEALWHDAKGVYDRLHAWASSFCFDILRSTPIPSLAFLYGLHLIANSIDAVFCFPARFRRALRGNSWAYFGCLSVRKSFGKHNI